MSNNSVPYNSTYFYALTLRDHETYNPKPHYFQETHDGTSGMPAQLFDLDSLYRAETAMKGNQVLQQKFYKMPFTLDIHFGYRDEPFTEADMNTTTATESFNKAEAALDKRFDQIFVHNSHKNSSHINGMPKAMSKFLGLEQLDDGDEWSKD